MDSAVQVCMDTINNLYDYHVIYGKTMSDNDSQIIVDIINYTRERLRAFGYNIVFDYPSDKFILKKRCDYYG